MNYYIHTFGCKVSQYESQAIREAWQKMIPEAEEVNSPSHAELLCIASCAVTREGVTDARQLCNKWRKVFPKAHIIVTGCAAEVASDDFKNADACIPQKKRDILLTEHPLSLKGYYPPTSPLLYPPFEIKDYKRSRPVIKIQDGCSHLCSYCIVPYTRGPSRSRPLESILEEVETLLHKGFRECVISGINLRQYSYNSLDFWDVLNALQEKFAPDWENKIRFRLSSLEPAQLNQKGIESLTRSSLIAPHLHLSLQSGSQAVLEKMKREHYNLKTITHSLEELRKTWEKFALGADFLLGFPSESQAEFEETLSFIKDLPLTYAHVFPYSQRPNTLANRMEKQIEKHIKQERTALVRELIEEKQKDFIKSIAEEELILSLDINHNSKKESIDAIDQYYTSCILEDFTLKPSHELIKARVSSIQGNRFIVKALQKD